MSDIKAEKTIYDAISEVNKTIKEIGKSKKNELQNFKYAPLEQTYLEVREAMAKVGLVLIPNIAINEMSQTLTTKNNKVNYALITMEFTFYYRGQAAPTIRWVGEAMDSGDKSYSKAISFAYKTFLNSFFMIPRVDCDPDGTSEEGMAQPHRRADKRYDNGSPQHKVLNFFNQNGLDWLQKGKDGHEMFKHFLVKRCGIYNTYILKYTIDEANKVLREVQEIIGEPLDFPPDTKYVEQFRKSYKTIYDLGALDADSEKIDPEIKDGEK